MDDDDVMSGQAVGLDALECGRGTELQRLQQFRGNEIAGGLSATCAAHQLPFQQPAQPGRHCVHICQLQGGAQLTRGHRFVLRQQSPRGDTIYWIGPAGDAREAIANALAAGNATTLMQQLQAAFGEVVSGMEVVDKLVVESDPDVNEPRTGGKPRRYQRLVRVTLVEE